MESVPYPLFLDLLQERLLEKRITLGQIGISILRPLWAYPFLTLLSFFKSLSLCLLPPNPCSLHFRSFFSAAFSREAGIFTYLLSFAGLDVMLPHIEHTSLLFFSRVVGSKRSFSSP